MKVAVWHNNRDIRIEEVPRPTPGPREMLVRVMSCGICGSDLVEWYRLPRAPLVQGHEVGAEVAEVGAVVAGYRPGDRVCVAPKVPCLECQYCRAGHYPVCPHVKVRLPGAFAEYILVPEVIVERGTYRLPASLSYDQSTFIEPLACVVRAQRLAGLAMGQSALILGSGMSGLLHVKLARARGCRVAVADVNPERLALARANGADFTLDAADLPARLPAALGGKADVVMLCTSALTAVADAWRCVDKGGAVVFFAVPGPEQQVTVPLSEFWTQDIRVLTAYYCGPPDLAESLRLLATGTIAVEDMITHRLPLQEIARGFGLVREGRESLKVIIRPQEG
ncbi:MAG: alcohol dehydrogenase catalytic domain-containing protein [Deltaproteobacteria bacterium]|nr:alcohol dehydrogenase catalytic domain-containing protein [Deltaproteobacteria bacterium]